MTDRTDLSTKWINLTTMLAGIAREHYSSSNFLAATLQTLERTLNCSRVTYLYSLPDSTSGARMIVGASYPADTTIVPLNAEGLTVFGEEISLREVTLRRFYKHSIVKDGVEYSGLVLQIALYDNYEQHTLSFTYDPAQHVELAAAGEQAEAFIFLELLANIVNSKHFSEADGLRASRFNVMKEILSQTGTVGEVARKICTIWRNWLEIPAVRLWAFNNEFNELNLLYACYDEQYERHFENSRNRLAATSVGASAIANREITRTKEPMQNPQWDADAGLNELLENELPHLICIPVISPDVEPDGSNKPRFVGLIDLHVRDAALLDRHLKDISSVDHPDSRLLFLGTVTAAALLRARSFERYEIIKQLNQMAIELVNTKDMRRLDERKEIYLSNVKDVILKAVHAQCVSIFEADESRDIIRCVATTGIQREPDFRKKVFYRAGEGITWETFATGKYKVFTNVNASQCPEYQGRFREQRSLGQVEDHDPHLIFPLPGQTSEAAMGVIRVVERTCSIYKNRLQNFSNHDVDLIKLIAHQVSPALQMIRMQAHRELFVNRTAHQVIQPLQGILAYVSNIIDGIYEDDLVKKRKKQLYIRQMARAAVGMMRSTMWASAVTDFSFLSNVERASAKLTEYFMDRVIDLQPIREHDNIRVTFVNPEEADGWGDFLVDEQFFEQVVQNLLHNGVKYSYPRTNVELRLKRSGRDLTVMVSSTGVPIDEADRERIFVDRERGLVASLYDPQGTGQGLYIARHIMRGFGGSVTLGPPRDDRKVAPPHGYPTAQRSTFIIFYPEAFAQ